MSKSDEVLAQQMAGQKQNVTLAEAKAEAAKNSPDGTDGSTTAKGKTTKTRAAKTDGDGNPVTTTPRVKIAPGSTPSQVLAAHLGDNPAMYEHCRLLKTDKATEATAEATGAVINKLAKKVAEKAVNLLRNRAAPDKIQVYTRIGMDQLLQKGELTSKALTDHFLGKYKPGTARAQANQIMNLFPALKVADKVGSTLTVNDDSVIVQAYKQAKG